MTTEQLDELIEDGNLGYACVYKKAINGCILTICLR